MAAAIWGTLIVSLYFAIGVLFSVSRYQALKGFIGELYTDVVLLHMCEYKYAFY